MDLRDEVAGTDGTIWLNHFLRTGFEMFTAAGGGRATSPRRRRRPLAGCSPSATRSAELGYVDMFTDMFNALDEGRAPRETFYDGYVVNAVMDACYRSAKAAPGSRSSRSSGAVASHRGSLDTRALRRAAP